jgi:hypothetical protein
MNFGIMAQWKVDTIVLIKSFQFVLILANGNDILSADLFLISPLVLLLLDPIQFAFFSGDWVQLGEEEHGDGAS